MDASARECTSDAGGLTDPGEDTGGSGPGQTGNQGDGLWPVSHCQGSHLDRRTHKDKPIVCRSVDILRCVYIDWCRLAALSVLLPSLTYPPMEMPVIPSGQ